jgi:hypothetical protein
MSFSNQEEYNQFELTTQLTKRVNMDNYSMFTRVGDGSRRTEISIMRLKDGSRRTVSAYLLHNREYVRFEVNQDLKTKIKEYKINKELVNKDEFLTAIIK